MDALGGFLETARSSTLEVVRALVFLGVLLLTSLLERLQQRLREAEVATWWVSNGRDVLNVFALAACTLGLRFLGFHGPLALCLAAILTLSLGLLQSVIEDRRLPFAFSLGAALLVGVPVALQPAWFASTLRAGLVLLFGPV